MGRLQDKVGIVTGAARGIGRAVAEGFAREGAQVVIADRAFETAQEVARGIAAAGGRAVAVAVDVAIRAEVEHMVAAAVSSFGTPDILVCCAGITHMSERHGFLELADEEWDAVLDINLRGTFLCAQVVARRMVAAGRPGSLITVSSIGASRPAFGVPAYHAAKGGVAGLTQALAVNLAPHRIRANGLAPGYILTDMTRDVLDDQAVYSVLLGRIPLYRMGDPGELAGAAIFLAGDESAYMTGQILHIDGGALVHGWVPAGPPEVAPPKG